MPCLFSGKDARQIILIIFIMTPPADEPRTIAALYFFVSKAASPYAEALLIANQHPDRKIQTPTRPNPIPVGV